MRRSATCAPRKPRSRSPSAPKKLSGTTTTRRARQHPPGCVLVDLANPGLVLEDLLRRLEEVCPARPRVVAYGSHVDTATLRAARAAGCDPVLPRSKFVEDLPTDLPAWLSGGERGG